jgi:hypothetical protein
MENVGTFCGHLQYLRPFGIFKGHLVISKLFTLFGTLNQKQSGCPDSD